jgi:8-hydroxy-5-deazaflavin:NADPH oxidoreductase
VRFGVLGTGAVGLTIATKLVALGHEVKMGSRAAGNEKATAWVESAGEGASEGSFADAASFGEIVFNCTAGAHSLAVLEAAGRESLAGKIIVDVALPLDFSRGMPPSLGVCNTDSLGEQIQRAFPDARVVKTLNTMNAAVMTEPVGGEVFVCGDDADAKREVTALLVTFGWPAEHVVDLGVISAARGTEMYLPLWLSLYGALGTGQFNIAVVGRTP